MKIFSNGIFENLFAAKIEKNMKLGSSFWVCFSDW